jgi:hypothetical protein
LRVDANSNLNYAGVGGPRRLHPIACLQVEASFFSGYSIDN